MEIQYTWQKMVKLLIHKMGLIKIQIIIILMMSIAKGNTVNELKTFSETHAPYMKFWVTKDRNNTIKYIHGVLSEPGNHNITDIQIFLEMYKDAFGIQNFQRDLILKKIKVTKSGNTHFSFGQQFRGIPVLYRDLKVHTNSIGQITSISNQLAHQIHVDPIPAISKSVAKEIAKEQVENRTIVQENQLSIYVNNETPHLVYKIDLAGMPVSKTILVDAHSGNIVKEMMQTVAEGPTVGQGITNLGTTVDSLQMYAGNGFAGPDFYPDWLCESFCWDYGDCGGDSYPDCELSFGQGSCEDGYIEDCAGDCWNDDLYFYWFFALGNGECETNNQPEHPEIDSLFYLVDESAPNFGNIYTISSFGTNLGSQNWIPSADNLFDSEDATTSERSGTEAHYYIRRGLDYFYNVHGYEGVNGNGTRLGVVVDFTGFNAYYNMLFDVTSYGFGGITGSWHTLPWSSDPDIVGHEITHGITFHSSGLLYQNHSGALNESISDIFGYLIEYDITGNTSWLLAAEMFLEPLGYALRDLSDPPAFGQPDHMIHFNYIPQTVNPTQDNDFGGVHTNSGIPNKVFYLLVEGGTHYGWQVEPMDENIDLSREMAAELAFVWTTQYLSAEDEFWDAREKMLLVAADHFPDNPEIWSSVYNAWASVGVNPHVDISVPSGYFEPGSDTLEASVDVSGYSDQLISARLSITATDSSLMDTLDMTINENSMAISSFPVPNIEALFRMSVHLEAIGGLNVTHDYVGQFLTAGPVDIHGFSFEGNPQVMPGMTLLLSVELENHGNSGTVPNVITQIVDFDTSCFSIVDNNAHSYGNLLPGEISEQDWAYFILILDDDCELNTELFLTFNIIISGELYWSDTISFVVGEFLTAESDQLEPNNFVLNFPFPNPFNPKTMIRFNIPEETLTSLTIFDINGRKVESLINAKLLSGDHKIEWDASSHASGIYFLELTSGDFRQTKKMVLLK